MEHCYELSYLNCLSGEMPYSFLSVKTCYLTDEGGYRYIGRHLLQYLR